MKKEESERLEGTIIWFDSSKRYGFILGEDELEYFLYINDVDEPLKAEESGAKCIFTPDKNLKGLIAVKVEMA